MLRFLLFSGCLLGFLKPVTAQDWKTVQSGDTTYFTAKIAFVQNGHLPPSPDTTVLRSLWITDVQTGGVDTTFYFFTGIRGADFNSCIDTAAPHWLGRRYTRLGDGRELYYNSFGDTITMHPNAPPFSTWVLAHDTGGLRFEGTIGSVGMAMVDGVMDSVKTLYIQAFSGTAPVMHEFNNMVLQWSKNHGWIKTLDFYRFPNYLDEELVGTQANRSQHVRLPKAFNNLNLDSVNLPAKYTPGNEWMWLENRSSGGIAGTTVNGHDSVIAATPFGNGIVATLRRRTRTVIYGAGTDVFKDTVLQDTVLPVVPRPVHQHILPDYKDRPMHETVAATHQQRNHMLYRQYLARPLCGGDFYRIGDREIFTTPTPIVFQGCWVYSFSSLVWSRWGEDVVPGFGRVFSRIETDPNSASGTINYEVYYFKMGNCTVGGKLPIPNGIQEQIADNSFSIFPNPADDETVVRLPNALPTVISVFDAAGRTVVRVADASSSTRLSTAHLPSGIYFMEISRANSRSVQKLQVLH